VEDTQEGKHGANMGQTWGKHEGRLGSGYGLESQLLSTQFMISVEREDSLSEESSEGKCGLRDVSGCLH
jgi:hypothetical protein